MGGLSTVAAVELGATAIRSALDDIGLHSGEVDEVFMGQVLQTGCGQSPARQAAIRAGIGADVPCTTVNKVCASGMKSIQLAAQTIALGMAEVAVAGGMESMSQSPHFTLLRNGLKFGAGNLSDVMQVDGLTDAYDQVAMGVFADATAEKYQISRAAQDTFAIQSYKRSAKAWGRGFFSDEIAPVVVPQRKGDPIVISEDEEYTRVDLEKISKLRPAFGKAGTVTAANASTINDGAAAVVLMSEEKASALGLTPMATIVSQADAAQEPQWFTTAPAQALPKALARAQLTTADIDWFELNEAFSVVGLANIKLLELDPDKVNPNGGAVSLGHPLGCSGARIVVSLLSQMQKSGTYGAAAVCNGGGGASALILKK